MSELCKRHEMFVSWSSVRGLNQTCPDSRMVSFITKAWVWRLRQMHSCSISAIPAFASDFEARSYAHRKAVRIVDIVHRNDGLVMPVRASTRRNPIPWSVALDALLVTLEVVEVRALVPPAGRYVRCSRSVESSARRQAASRDNKP